MVADVRELSTRDTLQFVTPWLKKRARVLEVGCGSGALASAMAGRGCRVVAIDASAEAVAAARRRGVPAIEADVCAFDDAPFDAVLFTRSLHHIHPLGVALDRAQALLKPGGVIVLEEFAYKRMDARTACWFQDALGLAKAAGRLQLPHRWRVGHGDELERWMKWHAHDHELHTETAMRAAVRRRFAVASEWRGAYLWRYAVEMVEPSSAGAAVVSWMKETETARVLRRELRPIGWRLVARGR